MECSRQAYWSGFPFPPPGDLPHPEIKPTSPALAGDTKCIPLGLNRRGFVFGRTTWHVGSLLVNGLIFGRVGSSLLRGPFSCL